VTCDTNAWADYTAAECTSETMDAGLANMDTVLASATCKDAAGMQMRAEVYLKIEAKTCAGKGTMKATWTSIEKAAADKMATLTACTA
jgi:hypothetical protein